MGERLIQDDFFQICPEGTRFPYSRSLRDVLTRDFLLTADCIRKLYIPGYSPEELAGFSEAFGWVERNLERFLETGFIGGPKISTLPMFVRFHHSCLEFLLLFGEDMLKMPNQQAVLPVAYTPGFDRWQEDIRAQTKDSFDQLKKYPLESRSFDIEFSSSTRTLAIVQEAFSSGWIHSRAEASDLLTSSLFISYWKTLKRRARLAEL